MKFKLRILGAALAAGLLFGGQAGAQSGYPAFRPDGSPVKARQTRPQVGSAVSGDEDAPRSRVQVYRGRNEQGRPTTTFVLPSKKESASGGRRDAAPRPVSTNSGSNLMDNYPAAAPAEERPAARPEKQAPRRTGTTIAYTPKTPDDPAPAATARAAASVADDNYGYKPDRGVRETSPRTGGKNSRKTTTITYGRKRRPPQPPEDEAALRPEVESEGPSAGRKLGRGQTAEPKDKRRAGNTGRRAESPPPPAPPAVSSPQGFITEEEMARAYKAFDYAYENSLGKTRRELDDLWGFDVQRMGDNGEEVAYGFRQRGVLNLPEKTDRKSKKPVRAAHYSPGKFSTDQAPGKPFACLVILWVDKKGRGVVVDGDAVGDCFIVESLSQMPKNFER